MSYEQLMANAAFSRLAREAGIFGEDGHITPAVLCEVGECLYGALWQSQLARELAVSDRTVRRWATGTHPVPDRLHFELSVLLRLKSKESSRLLRRLKKSASEAWPAEARWKSTP